jgi:hypothetical protein
VLVRRFLHNADFAESSCILELKALSGRDAPGILENAMPSKFRDSPSEIQGASMSVR